MYNKTIWKENIKPLLNNKKIKKQVDVLIIGGGIAGMTALYQLSETKKNILLIDKGRIGLVLVRILQEKLLIYKMKYMSKLKICITLKLLRNICMHS